MMDIEKRANLCMEHGRKYFQNIIKQKCTEKNFENYFKNVHSIKEMGQMKYYFVFIALGSHLLCLLARSLLYDSVMSNMYNFKQRIIFHLPYFLDVDLEWELLTFDSDAIDLVFNRTNQRQNNRIILNYLNIETNWIFTVSVLILTQAYGGKIKTYKYYYCATFLAYEFVWICSIFTYVYLWIKRYSDFTQKSTELSNAKLVTFFYAFAAGYLICSHWTQNTCVHLSLCRREIFAVS